MNIHIGEKIKERAHALRIGPTEFARRINTTKQNIGWISILSGIKIRGD
jgi:hypothetical protein